MPTVTIEGTGVQVPAESTILDAAKKAGVWIPTLCYSPVLPATASCRICLVELDRGGWSQLVTACNYPVRRDITVRANSERAVKARRGVMQLLLARSPESMELKELALRMGVRETPYPTVTESQRNCILCGLCISVCEEVIGCSAIGYAGRSADRTVTTPFRLASEDCIACGACAAVCPVGTIQVRIHRDTGEAEISPFKSRAKLLVCEECGRQLVTEPVGAQVLERVKIDWEEFRKRARLCPECRRKHAAGAMGLVTAKKRTAP
ncbi:MAG: 2Fe-2S iron-sulfur cluster-binding protein [Spirochaetota bacterium]